MKIKRIDDYNDLRFTKKVLLQHGCFLVNGKPYEVEIVSNHSAIIRGEDKNLFLKLIDEFRFYAPHIYEFYDEEKNIVKIFPKTEIIEIPLDKIQPSQFYIDEDKVSAISNYIKRKQDIIIQVIPYNDKYISLDGHTRLYYATIKGYESVYAVVSATDEWIYKFVLEAKKRNIFSPKDMILVNHQEYEEKWNRFCDEVFNN